MRRLALLCLLPLLLTLSWTVRADHDAPFAFEKIADGVSFPTGIVQSPGEKSRLFIVDLKGKVTIVENGVTRETPFLDLSATMTSKIYGQGLFNLAFHPDYADNGLFFVTYTQPDGNVALARYRVSDTDPNVADPTSGKTLMVIAHPTQFHYGGQLAFGPDGDLYWSMGDGAYKQSPAQDFHSPLGAILRLDVDHGDPYAIPADNPFADGKDGLPELWAKGLRNPWRFSFDRQTNDLYIADVGETAREEIDFQPAGSPGGTNFGWNRFEGDRLFNRLAGIATDSAMTKPVVTYRHSDGNCSITGGYVYRGTALPALEGKYLFGDFCSGMMWSTYQQHGKWMTTDLLASTYRITTFGQDNAGELYVGDARTQAVYKLVTSAQ